MKHGPNALIDQNLPVVILATCDRNDPGSVVRYELHAARAGKFMIEPCAGAQIGASAKAFTAQLYLFALYRSQVLGTTYRGARLYQRTYVCARQLESLLTYYEEDFEELAKEYLRSQDFLFLGRGIHYPVAL